VTDLNEELRRLADEAAREARPLAVAEVIRQGDRRQRRAITRWSLGRAPRPATGAGPGPHRDQYAG